MYVHYCRHLEALNLVFRKVISVLSFR